MHAIKGRNRQLDLLRFVPSTETAFNRERPSVIGNFNSINRMSKKIIPFVQWTFFSCRTLFCPFELLSRSFRRRTE